MSDLLFGFDNQALNGLEDNKTSFMINPDKLISYRNHMFPAYNDEDLEELAESISSLGQVSPVLIYENENGDYEILSGHNRTNACKKLGIDVEVKLIDKTLTEDEKYLIVIESNIKQRNFQAYPPSKKAEILAVWYEKKKNQGRRSDLERTSQTIIEIEEFNQESTVDESLPNFSVKNRQVANYHRIHNFLADELKDDLDQGVINITGAVELSFIGEDDFIEQQNIHNYLSNNGKKLSAKQAKVLRDLWDEDNFLSLDLIETAMTTKKEQKKEKMEVKLNEKFLKQFFHNDESNQEIKKTIEDLLKEWVGIE